MADVNFEKEPSKKKTKRSRHWDEKETEILVSKWSEENIQERLKSCTRKKAIWKEISTGTAFLKFVSSFFMFSPSCSQMYKNASLSILKFDSQSLLVQQFNISTQLRWFLLFVREYW